jgi:hypothetical protein
MQGWVRLEIGVFLHCLLHCLRAEMSLRCRWRFPGKERCLLDHLSPFGTSCNPSFTMFINLDKWIRKCGYFGSGTAGSTNCNQHVLLEQAQAFGFKTKKKKKKSDNDIRTSGSPWFQVLHL